MQLIVSPSLSLSQIHIIMLQIFLFISSKGLCYKLYIDDLDNAFLVFFKSL